MTLTQFKYVLEINRTGSINKAAANLFVSQSVLSTAIKNLENELGYQIFTRTHHGIVPTPLGKTFISYIRPIHEQVQNINSMIKDVSERNMLSLSIASSGWTFLSTIMAKLYNRYKDAGLRLEYHEAFGSEPENLVANSIADIGFIRRYTCYQRIDNSNFKALKLQFFPIVTGDIGITVSPQNPLYYNESDHISPDMLGDSIPIFHTYFDAGPYSNTIALLGLPRHASRFVISSRAAMYEILSQTNSYYINSVFPYNKNELKKDNPYPQRTLILSDCDIKSEFGWFKRKDYTLSTMGLDLIDMVSEHLSNSIFK